MKLTHQNLELIENWLNEQHIQPELDHDLVRLIYSEVLLPNFQVKNRVSPKHRKRAFTLQYDFVRRDLLKIIYRRNNKSASGIKAGYVYAIVNPAWPEYVKIGSAIDVDDRLNSYQTSSPLRDYRLVDYYFTEDRHKAESKIHDMFERQSEWCKVSESDIRVIFKKEKEAQHIKVPEELIYAEKNRIIQEERLIEDNLIQQRLLKQQAKREEYLRRKKFHNRKVKSK